MVEPPEDQDVQTMTAVGKVLVTDDSTALDKIIKESEEYTSQTCCICGTKCKSNRVHRGLYVCIQYGAVINAGVNGAINSLKRYLPGQISISWSSGCLAQPAVNRFAWRETKPSRSAHKPGTWQTSLPHPQTESVAALSSKRA